MSLISLKGKLLGVGGKADSSSITLAASLLKAEQAGALNMLEKKGSRAWKAVKQKVSRVG